MPKWIVVFVNSIMIAINIPFALQGHLITILTIGLIAIATFATFSLCSAIERI